MWIGCTGKLAVVIAEVLLTLSVSSVLVVSSLSLSESITSGGAGSQQAPFIYNILVNQTYNNPS